MHVPSVSPPTCLLSYHSKKKSTKKATQTSINYCPTPRLYARYSLPMISNPRACVKTEASFVNSLILPSILSEIGNIAKNLNVTKVPTLVYLRQYHHRDI